MDILRLWLGYAARLSQFGSQVPEIESQTHASRANHSCEVPHEGQNERLKKTGMERNLPRSMCIPVVTGLPVFGQRIMSSPIPTPQNLMHAVRYNVDQKRFEA